jgi:hypothetical protein
LTLGAGTATSSTMKVYIHRMTGERLGVPTLDMTPEGEFRTPPQPTWAQRILRAAIVVAVLAAGLAIAALALWFALILIPIALGAALVAYLAFRWRIWQARRSGGYDLSRR